MAFFLVHAESTRIYTFIGTGENDSTGIGPAKNTTANISARIWVDSSPAANMYIAEQGGVIVRSWRRVDPNSNRNICRRIFRRTNTC
jgi:hypothetical protein